MAASDSISRCRWPGCQLDIPSGLWGCHGHWFALPVEIRLRIWQAYRPGMDRSAMQSGDYLNAVQDAANWIAEHAKLEALGA